MLALLLLILAIIIGLGLSLFANQNPQTVSISLGTLSWKNIPLYLIVTLSLLLGLGVAWIFGIINSVVSSVTIFDKDLKINKTKKINQELNARLENFKIENDKLKNKISSSS